MIETPTVLYKYCSFNEWAQGIFDYFVEIAASLRSS